MMNAKQQRRLSGLRYYSTIYELAATHPDGRRVLVAYTRTGRNGIYAALRNRADHLQRVVGTLNYEWAERAAHGLVMGEWQIGFTGRTQREAIIQGELPYIGEL